MTRRGGFSGTDTEYRMLHYWVEKQLGTPQECENCFSTGYSRYHWANISGGYKRDVSDWVRLCPSCHGTLDAHPKDVCKHGHALTEENTRRKYRKDGRLSGRDCIKCQRIHYQAWAARQKTLKEAEL